MWSKVMAFLVTLIFIAAGCILLLVPEGYLIAQADILSFIEKAYADFGTRFIIICIGLGLLVLGLFNVYLFFISLRRRPYVVIRGPQGNIQIAYRTIEEVVEKVRRNIDGIDKVSTRIIRGRKKISLEVRLFLGSVRNVLDISQRVQEFVKDEVEKVMGITNLGKIRIYVKRITVEKEKGYEDILEGKRISRGIELQR